MQNLQEQDHSSSLDNLLTQSLQQQHSLMFEGKRRYNYFHSKEYKHSVKRESVDVHHERMKLK